MRPRTKELPFSFPYPLPPPPPPQPFPPYFIFSRMLRVALHHLNGWDRLNQKQQRTVTCFQPPAWRVKSQNVLQIYILISLILACNKIYFIEIVLDFGAGALTSSLSLKRMSKLIKQVNNKDCLQVEK